MTLKLKNLFNIFVVLSACCGMAGAHAAAAPNPRGTATVRSESRPDDTRSVNRTATNRAAVVSGTRAVSASAHPSSTVSRTAASVSARTGNRPSVSTAPRVGTTNAARSATSGVVRGGASTARSAVSAAGLARAGAGIARATAVFDDVSKIGSGYAACRDAYATCMDQLCAKANDTYRRCFCSARFSDFRDTEAALDQAKILLQRFEDNNLNAVDKTVDEVNAMYTATVGEAAIKDDTSAAAATLAEIDDLLSGRKKLPASGSTYANSLGVLSFDIDDIWGGSASDSIFNSNNSNTNLANLEGQELYNSANRQCLQLVADTCDNNAVLNMATSSYNILISQDCNAYEKKIDSQKELVKQTVRTAEKYLREARLDEYRAHNSADVNECIVKVKEAITTDAACGQNYKKCLDYTGVYINTNGEPIYSNQLFKLEGLTTLSATDTRDSIGQNAQFNKFLETKKMFVTSALDSCRDIADTVWEEFKRSAIVEIAQAQSALLEGVKDSCIDTIKECYDTQSGALTSFDKNTAKVVGALSVQAARYMCRDKVIACARLYGGTEDCKMDSNGKISNEAQCGYNALMRFIETADTVRIADGCATAIDDYLKGLCTPTSGTQGYPWNCRTKQVGNITDDEASSAASASIAANVKQFAVDNCFDPASNETPGYDNLDERVKNKIASAISAVKEQMAAQLSNACDVMGGVFVEKPNNNDKVISAFNGTVYGTSTAANAEMGQCVENTAERRCLDYNYADMTLTKWDATRQECEFTDAWYKEKCQSMSGYYEGGICYVAK